MLFCESPVGLKPKVWTGQKWKLNFALLLFTVRDKEKGRMRKLLLNATGRETSGWPFVWKLCSCDTGKVMKVVKSHGFVKDQLLKGFKALAGVPVWHVLIMRFFELLLVCQEKVYLTKRYP